MAVERAAISWSGGKDSALALDAVRDDPRYQVDCLITTLTTDRFVAVHEIPEWLLVEQARLVGLPLRTVVLERSPSNDVYQAVWRAELSRLRDEGISTIVFGDLFLADIRAWREQLVAPTGMLARFPLWQRNTRQLAHQLIEHGYQATVACVDTTQLSADFVGRPFDGPFLASLPATVDPCAERGEFHTLVTAAPAWHARLDCRVASTRQNDRFVWAEWSPA